MFQGSRKHKIDPKGRITIPTEFRDEFRAGAVISLGVDECVYIYPLSNWEELSQEMSSVMPSRNKARKLTRFIFGTANRVNLDAQGRIVIPPTLRQYANIQDTAFSVGMNTHLEIWSEKAWEKEMELLKKEAWNLFESIEERK